MCDTRFPLTHKFKNLKESALVNFQQKKYLESYTILQEIPIEKMDLSCKVLLAKTQKMCQYYSEAKELISNLLLEHPNHLDVLKEAISIYLKTHEYQKVLYYFSQLFSIETDHTNDIRHILNVYHKLGLYDRSFELLETLDKNGFPHELFLSERIDLAIHTADIMTLSQILTRYRHMLQNIPELLCKVLRNIEVGVAKNLKDELFLKYGSVHLGSYLDSNTSIKIYDSYDFDMDSFYESLLRFTDYVKFHKMKFSCIHAHDTQSRFLAKVLATILGLSYSEEKTITQPSTLIVGCDGSKFTRVENGIYFFLQCPSILKDYPEFLSQIVESSFQSFVDCNNKDSEQTSINILNEMQNKMHISSLTYSGQEVLYTRFDHFKLDQIHVETRQNVFSLVTDNHNQNIFSERSLDSFHTSIKNDELLYINSYLHKSDLIDQEMFDTLCTLHKKYDFCSVDIPSLLFQFNPDQTLGFYFSEFQTQSDNVNFVDIFHQLNHYKTQELQLDWFELDSPFHLTFFSKFDYWNELQEHEQFYPSLIKILKSNSPTKAAIFENLSSLHDFQQLTSILEQELLSKTACIESKCLIFSHLSKFNLCEPVLSKVIYELPQPHLDSIEYIKKCDLALPENWIFWLRNNRDTPLYITCIVQLALYDFFKSEWNDYWKDKQDIFPFASFYKIADSKLLHWIDQNVSDKSNLEYQKFLLLNHCFYPHLRDILINNELKLKLSKQLIQTYSEWVDNSPVKDLLFLMLSDDESKIALAKQYFLRGDIEYYMFLVNRFFTHGHKYGAQIICCLFEFRSDKAIQLLNEGLKQAILTQPDIKFLFHWIQEEPERKDEFLSFLQKHEAINIEMCQQLVKQLDKCPELLNSYLTLCELNNTPDDIKSLLETYPNHRKLLKEFSKVNSIQLLEFLKESKNCTRFSYNFQKQSV